MKRHDVVLVFETGCFLTILNMVSAGIAVSVVPEMAVSQTDRCSFIPIKDKHPIRVVGRVYQRSRVLTRAQQVFADFLRENSKQHSERPPISRSSSRSGRTEWPATRSAGRERTSISFIRQRALSDYDSGQCDYPSSNATCRVGTIRMTSRLAA